MSDTSSDTLFALTALSPLDGVGPDDLKVRELLTRLEDKLEGEPISPVAELTKAQDQAAAALATDEQTAQERRPLTHGAQALGAGTVRVQPLLIAPEARYRDIGGATILQ